MSSFLGNCELKNPLNEHNYAQISANTGEKSEDSLGELSEPITSASTSVNENAASGPVIYSVCSSKALGKYK